MNIFHFSDMHGNLSLIESIPEETDLIVSSGDFFPNCSRGNRKKEPLFQESWLNANKQKIVDSFRDLPVLCVNGNHDFISLADMLLTCTEVTPSGVKFGGFTFSGFGEIPFIFGEWNREVQDDELKKLAEQALASDPDILIVHAPCAGILDAGYGNRPLLRALTYQSHNVKYVLHGHVHEDGGKIKTEMSVVFSNMAMHGMLIHVLN